MAIKCGEADINRTDKKKTNWTKTTIMCDQSKATHSSLAAWSISQLTHLFFFFLLRKNIKSTGKFCFFFLQTHTKSSSVGREKEIALTRDGRHTIFFFLLVNWQSNQLMHLKTTNNAQQTTTLNREKKPLTQLIQHTTPRL